MVGRMRGLMQGCIAYFPLHTDSERDYYSPVQVIEVNQKDAAGMEHVALE